MDIEMMMMIMIIVMSIEKVNAKLNLQLLFGPNSLKQREIMENDQ